MTRKRWQQTGCLISDNEVGPWGCGIIWISESKYPAAGKWTLKQRWTLTGWITRLLNNEEWTTWLEELY